jgi:hypothetical protein
MKELILKLDHSNLPQTSSEDVKIQKFVSSISPLYFIKLLKYADNKVNPRIATVNKITKSIHETLETSPELFWLKSKGLLIATEKCQLLDRNRVKLTLENVDYEGIMDGGHNTFAIAIYLVEKLFDKRLKNWTECKEFWDQNYQDIELKFIDSKEDFKFSIPIEIITPTDDEGSINDFYDYISEICSARNNNVQLKETAKGNQVGFYDYLKQTLDDEFDIIWKTGGKGKIKSEDVISLASLSLIFLKDSNLLPAETKSLNKISLYSQKSKCIDFFNEVIGNKDISDEINGKYILKKRFVESALSLTKDILVFFDRLYFEFPSLYHKAAPGKFGRINAVDNTKKSKAPFYSIDRLCDYRYSYGFFYPLISGLTQLMEYDEIEEVVRWRINPRNLDLTTLDLTQYVELIRMVNFDPQKIGKGVAFYNESESIFSKILI